MRLSRHVLCLAAALAVGLATPASAEKVFRQANDLSFGGAESLDPLSSNRFIEVVALIYSRLMREGESGEASPELATSWTANAEATEWTLTLQPGVKFHDGSDFDAADVAYSLSRIEDPALESPVASVLGIIDQVEVVDPLTVKIILEAPHAGLPLLLLDYRVRMIPDGSGPTINENPVGTGPFRVEKVDAEGTTTLVVNEGYWEGRPKLDKIQFTAIPDAEARNQAMLAGQLDYNLLTAEQAPLYANNPAFQAQSFPGGQWVGAVFRTNAEPFTDPRVRRALRIAVDRNAMLTLLEGADGGAVGCDTPVKGSDPYVKVNLAPSDGYWDDVWLKEPAFVTAWDGRPADQFLNEIFRTGAGNNESFYSDPAFDALLDKARSTVDVEAARALYVQAQQMHFEDGGTSIPFLKNGRRVLSGNVTGIPVNREEFIRWHLVDLTE